MRSDNIYLNRQPRIDPRYGFSAQEKQFLAMHAVGASTRGRGRKKKQNQVRMAMDHGPKDKSFRIDILSENIKIAEERRSGSISCKHYPAVNRPNRDEKQIDREKKTVAWTLAQVGYGYDLFQQRLEKERTRPLCNITRDKYKTLIMAIVQAVYRKIQWFLRAQCQKLVTPIHHHQMRLANKYILHYNNYLPSQQRKTFQLFIFLTYRLKAVTLSEYQAVKLYKFILTMIRTLAKGGKVLTMQQTIPQRVVQPDEKDRLWNSKYQRSLVEFYNLNPAISKISQCFRRLYPETGDVFSPEFLQKKLEAVVKTTLKNIRAYYSRNNHLLPNLVELNDNRINFLAKSAKGKSIHASILAFRDTDELHNSARLGHVISLINQKLSHKNTEIVQQAQAQSSEQDSEGLDFVEGLPRKNRNLASKARKNDYNPNPYNFDRKADERFKIDRFVTATKPREVAVKINHEDQQQEESDQYS